MIAIRISVIFLLLMFAFVFPAVAEEDVMELTAEEIASVYNDNDLVGDQRFKGKKIRVSGVIDRIASDTPGRPSDDRPFVSLETPNIQGQLYCYFSKDSTPALLTHKKGQPFTAACTLKGKFRSWVVELEDCIIE